MRRAVSSDEGEGVGCSTGRMGNLNQMPSEISKQTALVLNFKCYKDNNARCVCVCVCLYANGDGKDLRLFSRCLSVHVCESQCLQLNVCLPLCV